MSNRKYGATGINGIQTKQTLICRNCSQAYVGHHLSKECDDCRFKECAASECHNKLKKSSPKRYCSPKCRPTSKAWPADRRVNDICKCGKPFPRYDEETRNRRRYCSDECREKYYWRPPTSDAQKVLLSQLKKGKPLLALRGYKQTEEHLIKRLGNGSIRASKEELALVEPLAKLGFRHTGEGIWWRRWPDGTMHNPDFVNEDTKIVVEYFGTYWHELKGDRGREDYIREQWEAIGYDCQIIWGP
jgi:hypothetical protein